MTSQAARTAPRPTLPMSAYSASAPVSARKTPPRMTRLAQPCRARKPSPSSGLIAASTAGWPATLIAPSTAMNANQSSMTGPNRRPIDATPNGCAANSVARITTAVGSTQGLTTAVITSVPSIALSTEIAGVITPSPYSSAAPNRPAQVSNVVRDSSRLPKCGPTSASRARIPPSPWLSARITSMAYFRVTTISSDQTSSDRLPSSTSWLAAPPASSTTVCSV